MPVQILVPLCARTPVLESVQQERWVVTVVRICSVFSPKPAGSHSNVSVGPVLLCPGRVVWLKTICNL